ncbi:hypothetical protein [Candidatus Methylacidithermus pantelleriae]|uniref:Transposase n=1 Tax=Candidatus Methylacidithermus pantelleriae TaxID=2744239 RepID=A0A8J2FQE8_9BACT|nr:hypothetical protein [Candidatus Methylacidithermus pantelleriae]CAF0698549.1 hypothetical protein MPNT_280022 [Candidatus Methylacidithermus pantelleriae]
MLASIEAQPLSLAKRRLGGAVGIDWNEDHLALAETDRFGNLVRMRWIGVNLDGKSEQEAKAIFGDAWKEIARACAESGKSLVIEWLDLRKGKLELESVDLVGARSLPSPAPRRSQLLKAAFFRTAVEVIQFDLAYTSVMGAANDARRHGTGFSHGGALCPCPERIGSLRTPIRAHPQRGGHVTCALPASNQTRHVWSFLWRGFGGDSKRRKHRMPSREAIGCLPGLCLSKTGTLALPGLCWGNPGRRIVAPLFGRRSGRSSRVGECLSMVLRRAESRKCFLGRP